MMLRVSKGNGGNMVSKWEDIHAYNEDQAPTATDVTKAFSGVYKTSMVERWNSLGVDKVKVELYNNGEMKAKLLFDARGSTKMNFFSKERLMSSTMMNMIGSSYNYFSIKGHDSLSRHFFANHAYGGCGGDKTFLCVVDDGNTSCDWMNKEAKPYFLYCPNNGPCNSATEAVIADTFIISVKTM